MADDGSADVPSGVPAERWDLIVIGAGPAGCAAAAAAVQADPSVRVLLLDRRPFPRDKPCGDGIAAEAIDVLAELDFDLDALLAGYSPITRLRLESPGGAVTDRRMARSVRVIPRQVFDNRLVADVLVRGVELRRQIVRSVRVRDADVLVDEHLSASVVIAADGAQSRVRAQISGSRTAAGPVALAIRGYADELVEQHGTQLITMARRHWPAYAWSFPIGDGRANVGYGELLTERPLTRADMLGRLRILLPSLGTGTDLRAHRLPLSPGRPAIADGRVLSAGDALSLINPLSGEGIFYAVRSGALAGRAATRGAAAGAVYRRTLAAALGSHLRSTDLVARLIRMPRLIDAGVRSAAADQARFDDLVRLGLGDGGFTGRLLSGLVVRLAG